ncbi:MAG: class I SAM-dependent methyltransferase [Pseudomonadota bacterium]
MSFSESEVEVIEVISVEDLIKSWQSDFSVETRHLFGSLKTIRMLRHRQSGIIFFDLPVLGDAAFYKTLRHFKWYHPSTKEEYRAAADWARADQMVLDVGAGLAGFADHVPKDRYIGLETDSEAVKDCRARGLTVHNMDMATYRAQSDVISAGLVTAFQVLEHVDDPDGFIEQMGSLTQQGGRVAVGVPDADSYVSDLPDFMLNAPPHHITWWTEASLLALMERQGLRPLEVKRFPVEPWERQLWWMAKVARIGRREGGSQFGRNLRARKVVAYLVSYALQLLPLPSDAMGSTLFIIAEKE